MPRFSVEHESPPNEAVIVGLSAFGLAGPAAVDYSVDDSDLRETGHVRVDGAPSITPFTEGRPRGCSNAGSTGRSARGRSTPVHAWAPGVEAAVRLVDTVDAVSDLGVDAAPPEAFAAEICRRYEDLADRIDERESEGGHDRTYV